MRKILSLWAQIDHAWEKRISADKIEQLQKLYVGKSREAMLQIYCRKRKRAFTFLGLLCVVVFLCSVLLSYQEGRIERQNRIKRQNPGGSTESVALETFIAGHGQAVAIEVAPRQYTAEELQAEFARVKQYVKETYLGQNETADYVTQDLFLMNSLENSVIQIEWLPDSSQLVEADGSIHWENIEKETPVEITVLFRYEEEEESLPLELTLIPPQRTTEETLWRGWGKEQERLAEQTETEEYLKLPDTVDGKEVFYQEPKKAVWKYLLLVISIGIPAVSLMMDRWLRRQTARRERELVLDYPEMLEQFVLLIGAGMTIQGAWVRIATEYAAMRRKGQREYRFVYEEMLVTMREVESGMSERKAYELFGRRLGILSYMKFTTLLVQNLRKGSDDLLRILEYEAVDAFRQRKEQAKALGEEAGTKMLMPMMLMLLVVLLLIIYAAFCSM